MINPEKFYKTLTENGIDFFAGVPDSLLKSFCGYVSDHVSAEKNVIAANEGGAVALTAGHYLATGRPGFVYMQNSGLGNAVNPLTSLMDKEVYAIPVLLLIGWRAEPGVKDEPQHIKMGKVTLSLLETLRIPYRILDDNFEKIIKEAAKYMRQNSAPFAIVAKKGVFEDYKLKTKIKTGQELALSREEAIKTVVSLVEDDSVIVSTTGMASRELFEWREAKKQSHEKDFLTVGSMGHASQIALGVAMEKPDKTVYCFDGDGAVIMHMWHLAIIGQVKPSNFRHIVFNNMVHDSVGGQPTAGGVIDIPALARASGYQKAFFVQTKKELKKSINQAKNTKGPVLIEIKVKSGARTDLGRPTNTPQENKEALMGFLASAPSVSEENSSEQLRDILAKTRAKNIFLVTGKNSFESSGAKVKFEKVLSFYRVDRFSDFETNPNLKDLEKGLRLFRKKKYDLVLAIGGGSAIDMAKLINIFSAQTGRPLDYIKKEKQIERKGLPLAAIPTTSGTGSEATHFAVVYADKTKHSVAHQYLLPSYVILDPSLTITLPKYLTASTGMDALCQAIESFWSRKATDVSRNYSREAVRLAFHNLEEAVKTSSPESKQAMMRAAHLAGKAINIAHTTAPHALSYTFTSHFGIPHGHAVGLTMGKIFEYNCRFNKSFRELYDLLGVSSGSLAGRKLEKLMVSIGLETRLTRLGVKESDLDLIAGSVNLERLKNNPVMIKKEQLKIILKAIL